MISNRAPACAHRPPTTQPFSLQFNQLSLIHTQQTQFSAFPHSRLLSLVPSRTDLHIISRIAHQRNDPLIKREIFGEKSFEPTIYAPHSSAALPEFTPKNIWIIPIEYRQLSSAVSRGI